MQKLTDLIEQEREKHEERIRQQEESNRQKEIAAQIAMAEKQMEYLAQPWYQAAKAAGIPGELYNAARIKGSDHVNPYSLFVERRAKYPGSDTYYRERNWRRILLSLPHCTDIEIQPIGGKNYGDQLETPSLWRLIVKIPTGIGEAYDWDDDTEEIYFVEYEDSEPYQIEAWRDAIGHAAALHEKDRGLMLQAEIKSEEVREEYRRQRGKDAEPKQKAPPLFDIAADRAQPREDRLIAAVLHLAERIDAQTERIADGIPTWNALTDY